MGQERRPLGIVVWKTPIVLVVGEMADQRRVDGGQTLLAQIPVEASEDRILVEAACSLGKRESDASRGS